MRNLTLISRHVHSTLYLRLLVTAMFLVLSSHADTSSPDSKTGKSGSDAAKPTQVILQLLDSPDPETRRRGVEMLASMGTEDAAKVLLTVLADGDAGVRESAKDALSRFDARELDGAVVNVLLGGNPRFVAGVDDALPVLRETLEPGMLARLTGEHTPKLERAAAAYALGRMRSKVATPLLAEYAKSKSSIVAITCAHALYAIGDEGSLRELVALTDSPLVEVRRAALYGMILIGGPEVLRKITDIASGKTEHDMELRQDAVVLLGYVGDWSTVELLIRLIRQQAGFGRQAGRALERLTGLTVGDRPFLWLDWYQEIMDQQKAAAAAAPPPLVPTAARQGPIPGLPPGGFPFIP